MVSKVADICREIQINTCRVSCVFVCELFISGQHVTVSIAHGYALVHRYQIYVVVCLIPQHSYLHISTLSVGVGRCGMGRTFGAICLFVCLSVCLQHNSKTNDPKVFKLSIGNDLEIYSKWCAFEVKRSRSQGQ